MTDEHADIIARLIEASKLHPDRSTVMIFRDGAKTTISVEALAGFAQDLAYHPDAHRGFWVSTRAELEERVITLDLSHTHPGVVIKARHVRVRNGR